MKLFYLIVFFCASTVCMDDKLVKSFIDISPQIDEDDFIEISAKSEVTNILLEFVKKNDKNVRFDGEREKFRSNFLNNNQTDEFISYSYPYRTTLRIYTQKASEKSGMDDLVVIDICVKKPKENKKFPSPTDSDDTSLLGLLLFNAFKIDKGHLKNQNEKSLDEYTTFKEDEKQIDFNTRVPLNEYLKLLLDQPRQDIYKTY